MVLGNMVWDRGIIVRTAICASGHQPQPEKYTGDEEEGWELDEKYLSSKVKNKLTYTALKAQEHPYFLRLIIKPFSIFSKPTLG